MTSSDDMTVRQKLARALLKLDGVPTWTADVAKRAGVGTSVASVTMTELTRRGFISQDKTGDGRTSRAQYAVVDRDSLQQIVDGTLPRKKIVRKAPDKQGPEPQRDAAAVDYSADDSDAWTLDARCDLVIESDELAIAIPRERIHALVAFLERTKPAWDRP